MPVAAGAAVRIRACLPCRRNGVRHHPGIASVMDGRTKVRRNRGKRVCRRHERPAQASVPSRAIGQGIAAGMLAPRLVAKPVGRQSPSRREGILERADLALL